MGYLKIYEIYAPGDIEEQHKNWLNERNIIDVTKIIDLVPIDVYAVLDYGCGTGRYSIYFVNYTGFDRNKLMIEFARNTYPTKKFVNNLPTQRYDLVLAVSVIQYYDKDSIGDLLEEIFSHSRRYVLIQTWDKEKGNEEMIKGFRNISTYLRPKDFYIKILSKYGEVQRYVIEKEENGSKTVYIISQ